MDFKDWIAVAAIVISVISLGICYWFYRAGSRRETLRDKKRVNDTLLEIAGSAVDQGYCSLDEASEAVSLFLTSVKGSDWIYMDRLNMQTLMHQGVWIVRQSRGEGASSSELLREIQIDAELTSDIKQALWSRKDMIPEIRWQRVEK